MNGLATLRYLNAVAAQRQKEKQAQRAALPEYRTLWPNEVVMEGDIFFSLFTSQWHPVTYASPLIGEVVTERNCEHYKRRLTNG